MSSYWDAVARAALGLPGSAAPRPRSIYEPDERSTSAGGSERLDEDHELDAHAVTFEPAPAAAEGAPATAALPMRAPELPEPGRRAAGSTGEAAHDEVADPARLDPRAADQAPARGTAAPAVETGAWPLARTIERIEVQRLETTRTVAAIASAAKTDQADHPPHASRPADATPLAAPWPPEGAAPATPAGTDDTAASLAVVAEPIAPPPGPVPIPPSALAPELPPLVIEIDRIDIRIEPDAAPAPRAAPRRHEPALAAAPSLADYLAGRGEARR